MSSHSRNAASWWSAVSCLLLMFISAGVARADLKIVTTTTDYADLAKQIGSDRVQVHSVMKGPENVHNVMAKPTEMVHLNAADLFVHSGLDTEPWRDNLLRGARNPKVIAEQPGNVDMSVGVPLKDVPAGKIDRSQGDVHSYGNPHFTLNLQIAQRMTATLAKAMIRADSANGEFYRQNAIRVVKDLAEVSREIKEQFAPYAGLKVVTFHDAWKYLADAVPIDLVGTIEPQPAITPSAAQVQQTIDLMKRQGVKVVVCETYSDNKLAQYVADQAGAKLVVLPDHVLGVAEADSYQKLFRYDVAKLIETAKSAGIPARLPESKPTETRGTNAR